MQNDRKQSNKADHDIKETKQVNMLLKRILELSEQSKIADEKFFKRKTKELEQVFYLARSVVYNLELHKSKYSKKYFERLNHEIRTPLVPIKAYCQMIQQKKYGTLNDEQKKRLDAISSHIEELEKNIHRLLSSKRGKKNE